MDPRISETVASLDKQTIVDILTHYARTGYCYIPGMPDMHLNLSEVCLMAAEYLTGYEQPSKITVIEPLHKKFDIGTRWKFLSCVYVVDSHLSDGAISFKSVNSENTFLEYSLKQMEEIKGIFEPA